MFAVGFSGWQAVRARNAEREQRRLREESERTTAELLRTRADVFGRSGEWNKAAADLLTVVKLDGTNHWDWFRLAALMVKTGQREQFEKVRHSMLEQFARTTEAKIADRVSKGSLLLPGDPEVVARAQVLAERAVLLGEKGKEEFLPYYQLTAALAAYRAGDLKTARELVAKALSEEDLDVNIQALARVQLAMIEYRVGDAVKARTTLTEARRLSEKLVKTSVGNLEQNYWQNWWHDWLILQILLEEAAATIR
jgi:tetratricopeptide (TPR) repeat protein